MPDQTGTLEDLGRLVQKKYPGAYDDKDPSDLGRRFQAKYPGAYDGFKPAQSSSLPDDPGAPDAPAQGTPTPAPARPDPTNPTPQPMSLTGPGAGAMSASGFGAGVNLQPPPDIDNNEAYWGGPLGLRAHQREGRAAAYKAQLQYQAQEQTNAALIRTAQRMGLTDPVAIANWVNKHPANAAATTVLKPNEVAIQQQPGGEFRQVGRGNPPIVIAPEGSQVVQPGLAAPPPDLNGNPVATTTQPASAGPASGPLQPGNGAQVLASVPPKLTQEEASLLAASQHQAQLFGLPFDPNLNPRNPLMQLPPNLRETAQMEASPALRMQRESLTARLSMNKQLELNREMEGQKLELEKQKVQQSLDQWNSTHSPQAIATIGQAVINQPDAFKTITDPAARSQVTQWLATKGLNPPRDLPGQLKTTEEMANLANNHVTSLRAILNDPQAGPIIKQRMGAWNGRVGNLEQAIGTTVGLSDHDAQLISAFRNRVTTLFTQEARANMPGRINQQTLDLIAKTAPNMQKGLPLFLGAMDGIEQSNRITLQTADDYRWNKKTGIVAPPSPLPSGQKIIVHASDGIDHPFDTEAQAKAFEAQVKQLNGTTSRK
jgi:hypothetical protein